MSKLYAAEGITKHAGMTFRQFDHWCRLGLLRPMGIEGIGNSGTGNPRIFDESEVRVARWMTTLVSGGMKPPAAAKTARAIEAVGEARIGNFRISLIEDDAAGRDALPVTAADFDWPADYAEADA